MMNPATFMAPQYAQGGMNQVGFAMAIAASTVIFTIFQQFVFNRFKVYLEKFIRKLINSLDPYVHIKFQEEIETGGPKNHKAFAAIETYLSTKCAKRASRLKANAVKDIKTPVFCIDDGEAVTDEFNGVKVTWQLIREIEKGEGRRGGVKEKYYLLTFRKRDWEIVVGEYLGLLMEEGESTAVKNRQLKLYSNCSSKHAGDYWNYIMELDHPANFKTLAMEEEKKQRIINDLRRFSEGRDYYRRIGKPWKRGYLLYGPPGTGKSTMIAAMANLLSYDVYDLELTAISDNAALKKLLNRTPGNSILVIEDIDCSSKITCQREKKEGEERIFERVTLSGLLNCVDGIFSANEGGRLMVFTTNHVENLDPALIRRGRMDYHIEMSFCGFEAFKVLAKNYLGIVDHELFPRIRELLQEIRVTPADVAENLIRNEVIEGSGNDCLQNLIEVLEKNKEEGLKSLSDEKTEQEARKEVRENGDWKKENGHFN